MLFANQSDSVISLRISQPRYALPDIDIINLGNNATPPIKLAIKDNQKEAI